MELTSLPIHRATPVTSPCRSASSRRAVTCLHHPNFAPFCLPLTALLASPSPSDPFGAKKMAANRRPLLHDTFMKHSRDEDSFTPDLMRRVFVKQKPRQMIIKKRVSLMVDKQK